jgi:predicted alpha/beta-fold hydrolase
MPNIKIPTVVMQALDDPIVVQKCIAQDVFDNNSNLALLTTKYGGHTAYYTSILGLKNWFMVPVLKYFSAYCTEE